MYVSEKKTRHLKTSKNMFLFPTIPLEKHGLNVTEDVKIKTNELLVLLSHCLSMFVFASQPGLATSDQSS